MTTDRVRENPRNDPNPKSKRLQNVELSKNYDFHSKRITIRVPFVPTCSQRTLRISDETCW